MEELYRFRDFLETTGAENSYSAARVASYSWVSDGISSNELEAIGKLSELLETAGALNSNLAEKFAGYPWVDDGVSSVELDALHIFQTLLETAGAANSAFVEKVAAYSWVNDGITGQEVDTLNNFHSLLEASTTSSSNTFEKLAGYSWVDDGVSSVELDALYIFQTLLETAGAANSAFVEKVAAYSWVADGITIPEPDAINRLRDLLRFAGAVDSELAEKIADYPWVADGLTSLEMEALDNFRALLETAAASDSGIVENLTYPWITGCVALDLPEGQTQINELLQNSAPEYSALLKELLTAPWLADGVVAGETETLNRVRNLLISFDSVNTLMAEKLAEYPWAPEGITAFECSALDRLRSLLNDADSELLGIPWFDDGIDDEELTFLAVLDETKGRSLDQYRDLLDSHHVRSKTITLPLAGEVKLLVFRHSPFPARDDSIELMEDVVRVLEGFMEVPFPWNPVVLGIIEPSLRAGEKPEKGAGYAQYDQLAITGREYNRDFHLAVFHEMSHIYWGGHTGAPAWFTEGAAGFLPDYAREVTGVQKITSRRVKLQQDWDDECRVWGAGTISRFLSMRETDPKRYESRGICTYALGEFFLLETYQLFGRDAASAAMRELYLQAEATGWEKPITEEQIYRAYLANAPRGKVEAFQALYQRYHGGAYDGG